MCCPCFVVYQKHFAFHLKRYNLSIHVVNFYESFCTCISSIQKQDAMTKNTKQERSVILVFALEMAVLKCFFFGNIVNGFQGLNFLSVT